MVNSSDSGNNSSSSNIFIRFKQNVDSVVRTSLDRLSGTCNPARDPKPIGSEAHQNPAPPHSSHRAESSDSQDPLANPEQDGFKKGSLSSSSTQPPTTSDINAMSQDRRREVDGPTGQFDQDIDIESWATHSPYSPFNLQDLPQPTPRDLGQAGYAGFTFRNAFEDLLMVSSGSPLPSSFEVVTSKLREEFMFRDGMPLSLWVKMLGMHGLWHPYFPQARRAHSHSSPFDFSFDWGFLPFGLNSEDAGVRFRPAPARLVQKEKSDKDHREEAETEEDLYKRSPTHKDEPVHNSPWDAMVRAVEQNNNAPSDIWRSENRGDDTNPPKESERKETRKTWDGGRVDKVWKCRENNGRIETVVTHYRYDADGNLVGQWEKSKLKYSSAPDDEDSRQYSSSSRRWSRTWSWGGNRGGCGPGNGDNGQTENKQQGDATNSWDSESGQGKTSENKKEGDNSGWFWTK